MTERLRAFKVTITVDTNKRTETETFEMDTDNDRMDTMDGVMAVAEGWAIDMSHEIF